MSWALDGVVIFTAVGVALGLYSFTMPNVYREEEQARLFVQGAALAFITIAVLIALHGAER